jgi:hypothetical protein
MRKGLRMNTVDYSHVVGVFREHSQAEQAIDKLKRIGISEDKIQLTEYNPQTTEEAYSSPQQESNKRLIVNVAANGKEQEAVGILVNNGANNADIPPGTELVHGSLVSSNSESAELNPGQPAGESSSDSFFGGKNLGEKL